MKILILSLLAAAMLAQDNQPVALPDSVRAQLFLDQRDYMIAKAILEAAAQKVEETAKGARAICDKAGKDLNEKAGSCVARPAPVDGSRPSPAMPAPH